MGLTKSSGNMYSWVSHTWNPIKGHCEFRCPYCYVSKGRAGKLWQYQQPCYLDEKELTTFLGKNKTIFVGSMGDMWGPWVRDEWIMKVLEKCFNHPFNTYVFQSKNPTRFFKWLKFIEDLSRVGEIVYLGTTIETDQYPFPGFETNAPSIGSRVEAIGRLSAMGMKTFVTIEPILRFNLVALLDDLRMMDPEFVTIGADSKGHGLTEPTWGEVQQLINNLGIKGIEIRQKKNLDRLRRIYKENLEGLKCGCGCAEAIFMHSKCHPAVPTWVKHENGILTLLCSECNEEVAQFAVRSIKEN